MKNSLLTGYCLILLLFTSCVNEEIERDNSPYNISIHVSVQEKKTQSRASDVVAVEYIKRYDTFIFETSSGALVDYKGSVTPPTTPDQFTEDFTAGANYLTPKDVFVVVNNSNWDGKSDDEMKAITRDELKSMEFTCTQHHEGPSDAMTNFNGYKKSASENEPFIMTVSSKAHNFKDNATLNMQLKRTYAKIVLKFTTMLTAAQDADWIELKTIRVRAINNVPKTARLFSDDGSGYTPTLESYVYQDSSKYELSSIHADLTKGPYSLDPFAADRLALRLFPQDASSDVNNKATSLLIDFEVGAVGISRITKNFKRLIKIGNEKKGYQIDPNYAYIITIGYGKTTNSITVDCQVIPWNLLYWEEDVAPN